MDPGWQTTPTNHPYYLWPLGLRRFAQTFSNIDLFITLWLQLSNKLIVFRVTALVKLHVAICANQMSLDNMQTLTAVNTGEPSTVCK